MCVNPCGDEGCQILTLQLKTAATFQLGMKVILGLESPQHEVTALGRLRTPGLEHLLHVANKLFCFRVEGWIQGLENTKNTLPL